MKFILYTIVAYLKNQSLNRLIMASMLSIAVLLVVVVGHNWVSYENRKFKLEYSLYKNDYMQYKKTVIKREVMRTLNYINYTRSLSQDKLMYSLSNRVETAWNIANNIYNEHKGLKTDAEIQKIIKDALRYYRINPNENDVYICTLRGVAVLDPENPNIEGKSCISLHDSLNNYMVKRELALLNEVDKGFIAYYHKNDQSNDSMLYKHSYVKKFQPYGWYLGSNEYLSDFEDVLKDEVLRRLADIRFDNDGYVFVQHINCEPIMAAGSIITENTRTTFTVELKDRQKMSELAAQGGGYIEYKNHRPGLFELEPKLAYVDIVNEWDWVIGAGFYVSDIDPLIEAKKAEIGEKRLNVFIRIFLGLSFILALGIFFTYEVNKKIKQGFKKFDSFFKQASEGSTPINEHELFCTEFKSLANSANKMVEDLKKTRKDLENEHSLLVSVMNSIPDMVFFKDLQSRYLKGNDAFLNYLQIKDEELFGKTDFELFTQDSAEVYYNNDLLIIKDGIPIRNEEWLVMPDGSKRLLDTIKLLCKDKNNNMLGILCISHDMTEWNTIQKKYIAAKEKAEEADRLKTAFLANMSHEIRTPMNSIVGFSNLISEGDLTKEEQSEYVEHINTAINNLLNLINDIIDIAKIEAGQLNVKPEYYCLGKLMEEVFISTSEYKKRQNREQVDFHYIIDEKLKNINILTDPYRLNQILTNLIVNAIKFTPKGSIELGCEKRQNELYFYVKDTGFGITKKDQEFLFKRFRQVGELNGYKAGGTGLGLAISKHLVELMNGNIGVESEKDKGSTFYFRIPYYPLQLDVNKQIRIAEINWHNKSILIIENDDPSFNYLRAVFSGTGAKVIRSLNCKEAEDILTRDNKIDLIYADMDEDDALNQLIDKIKSEYPKTPIIGQANYASMNSDISKKVDALIIKPVKYHLLLEAISPIIKSNDEVFGVDIPNYQGTKKRSII